MEAFDALPGARFLCTQHVLGHSEGKTVEIQFELYASTRAPGEAAEWYARAHGIALDAGKQSVTVAVEQKRLSVAPASAPHPDCGVGPGPGERTLIVVSTMWSRPGGP
jgi:hypothetical protein